MCAIRYYDTTLDTCVAPEMSKFTVFNVPELKSETAMHWVDRFVLLSSIMNYSFQRRSNLLHIFRKSQLSVNFYNEARNNTQLYLETGDRTIAIYYKALMNFEICIAQSYQTLLLISSMLNILGQNQNYLQQGGPNLIYNRMFDQYNFIKHLDGKIKADKGENRLVMLWLTNEGIKSRDTELTFLELRDCIQQDICALCDSLVERLIEKFPLNIDA